MSTVSGEGGPGMTITTRVLHGACRRQPTPALRTPIRRFSAAHSRAMAQGLLMPEMTTDRVPATAIV